MTGPHFSEILDTICITTNSKLIEVSNAIHIKPATLENYKKHGVPLFGKELVMKRLRNYMITNI